MIIDEAVIRRPTAPLEVLAAQYRVLAEAGDHIIVRVLPADATIEAFTVPKSSFSLYTYHDPQDGTIASVDTLIDDTVVTNVSDVRRLELYDRIREAAVSPQASADLLSEAADNMMERIMS
ncbi:hypothetical protein GCM10023317_02210 [Actinopolymorpha pittospori]|uniref:DUF5753 domain-containing protein n=1 Tax=Actinopolymorpha pittospori TaxID=648752 RepID=A0A927NCD9_9ACTN|nr:hypothetical protein [Actinopolymorpha pittospori]